MLELMMPELVMRDASAVRDELDGLVAVALAGCLLVAGLLLRLSLASCLALALVANALLAGARARAMRRARRASQSRSTARQLPASAGSAPRRTRPTLG